MKFILLVEGQTERAAVKDFLKKWFDERADEALLKDQVGISMDKFNGSGDLWRYGPKKAQMFLDNPKGGGIIAVIGLLDLYGANFIPPHITSAEQRLDWGTKEMEKKVDRDRFHMFFAVHEVEAWILSQPENLPFSVSATETKRMGAPEKIDLNEPPAKLLDRMYKSNKKGAYKKITNGTNLFKKLNPAIAYDKCPHLKAMLDEMLTLAKASQGET